MVKVTKTIKIETYHEEWLKFKRVNFSEWVRKKLDEKINQTLTGSNKKKVKAVILAAGIDENLFPLTEDIPKTLLDIKGKSILERQVDILNQVGITEIAVVRGYKKERISFPHVKTFDNDDYESSGSLVSLFQALTFMDCATVIVYGDILFGRETLIRLLESSNDTTLVVDRGWKKHYQDSREGHPLKPELTTLSNNTQVIKAVGVDLQETALTSEYIGLAKLSVDACLILKEIYNNIYQIDPKENFHNAAQIHKASVVDFFQELIDRSEKVTALEIWRTWIDVDTFEDYRNAWNLFDEIIGERK